MTPSLPPAVPPHVGPQVGIRVDRQLNPQVDLHQPRRCRAHVQVSRGDRAYYTLRGTELNSATEWAVWAHGYLPGITTNGGGPISR